MDAIFGPVKLSNHLDQLNDSFFGNQQPFQCRFCSESFKEFGLIHLHSLTQHSLKFTDARDLLEAELEVEGKLGFADSPGHAAELLDRAAETLRKARERRAAVTPAFEGSLPDSPRAAPVAASPPKALLTHCPHRKTVRCLKDAANPGHCRYTSFCTFSHGLCSERSALGAECSGNPLTCYYEHPQRVYVCPPCRVSTNQTSLTTH